MDLRTSLWNYSRSQKGHSIRTYVRSYVNDKNNSKITGEYNDLNIRSIYTLLLDVDYAIVDAIIQ